MWIMDMPTAANDTCEAAEGAGTCSRHQPITLLLDTEGLGAPRGDLHGFYAVFEFLAGGCRNRYDRERVPSS